MTLPDMPATDSRSDANVSGQIVTLTLFRFAGWRRKLWAFAQMGLARRHIAALPGIGFFKLMGAGTGEGFTPLPDTGAVAILTTWPSLEAARAQTEGSAIFRAFARRATERWSIHVAPTAARGAWSGRMPFIATPPSVPAAAHGPAHGPVVAITRATVRPAILLRFWRRVPDISRAIGANPDVLFKIGVGEVPWFHQVTFSIWPDADAMAAFARKDGPHARAIRAVREGGWFAEELYARFSIRATQGTWGGRDPLHGYPLTMAAE